MKGWSPRFVLTLGPMSVVNLLSLNELMEGAAGKSIHFSLIDLFIPTWAFVILISPKPRFIVLCYKVITSIGILPFHAVKCTASGAGLPLFHRRSWR